MTLFKTGDIDVGRSQLGLNWSGTPSSVNLWDNYFAANRYCITATSNLSINLPEIGTLATQAQPGYWVTIVNDADSAPFTVTVFDSTGLTQLGILYPTCSLCAIAIAATNDWTITQNTSDYVRAQFRAGVDPSSNPDPIIGGLLVPAGSTEFNMPITILPQSIGLADPFVTDPAGFFQFDPDGVNLMYANDYQASFNIYIIGFGASPDQLQVGQILQDGQTIFNAPPICSASDYGGSVVNAPLNGVIWLLTGTANFRVTSQSKIVMRLLMNSTTDLVVALTSNISIEKI